MSIFTKPTREAVSADPLIEEAARPELWTPPGLAALYAELAPSVLEQQHPLDAAPAWYDDLAGRTAFGSAPGAALADTVRRGTLAAHLREMLTATRYGGVQPGTVAAPAAAVAAYRPAQKPDGTESRWLQELKPVMPGDSAERDAARQLHRENHALVPEFVAAVQGIAIEVLSDRDRAWDAHVHIVTLDAARREHARRQQAEEAERQRLAVQQCPVCGESDPARIGPIAVRALVPGVAHVTEGVPSLRSCAACWNVATAEHLDRLAGERVGPGRETRRQKVARHLAALDGERL